MLVDSHCHIPMIDYEGGAAAVVQSALANGVGHMLCVAIDLETLTPILDLAETYPFVTASAGVHPNTVLDAEIQVDELLHAARHPDVIAIGETGLDYFRSRGDLDWQRERFRTHIHCARQTGKPLIIHSRDARKDVIHILREEGADQVGGIMHCFVDDWDTAQQAMELNFLISFSGIVTFRNARELQDVARRLPLDAMLVETDSPYLAPVPHRGKQNQPAYVHYVAAAIAELRGVAFEAVAHATTANFLRLFPGSVMSE